MNLRKLFRMRSFLRFLGKNKLYTFIEIFGLSVSLMFVLLIAIYTTQELSTDNFQQDSERLFFLANEENFGSAYRLGERIQEMYPEVEAVCPLLGNESPMPVTIADKKLHATLLFTEQSFFKLLSFPIINGDSHTPLATQQQAVISESFARKTFPDQDPLGQIIVVSDSVTLTVTAVMKDISNSVIPYADILLHIENTRFWSQGLVSREFTQYGDTWLLFQEKRGANLRDKEEDLLKFMKENVFPYKLEMIHRVLFVPFHEVYFSDIDGYGLRQGSRSFVWILLSVGLLILVFAIINYINLTVAQSGFRAKEMATRRLLGATRKLLFLRLIMESLLITLISFLFALFLAFLFAPYAGNLLETTIDPAKAITPLSIVITFMNILLISCLTGILPALILSNSKPIEVVKGSFRQKSKMVFSKFFITFQHAITIALVAVSLVMILQLNHLIHAPLGYHTTNIVDIYVGNLKNKQQKLTLGNELRQAAAVKQLSFSQGMPFSTGNNYTYNHEGRAISFQSFIGDESYIPLLGLEIEKEYGMASGEAFYLSNRVFRELELNEETTHFSIPPFFGGGSLPIAGVIRDFQLSNILYEPRPILLRIKKIEEFDPWNISIEVAGDPYVAMEEIRKIYERVTELEFNGMFVDQQIETTFRQQKRTSRIIELFTGIAILLSFLGLVAMSTYYIQQRSREIAIRKVFGSSTPEILRRLIRNFLLYVVIAFFIATPVVWYVMNRWLSDYSYRIALSPWIFLVAGLFCLLLSLVTILGQSYRAANANPVSRIKAE